MKPPWQPPSVLSASWDPAGRQMTLVRTPFPPDRLHGLLIERRKISKRIPSPLAPPSPSGEECLRSVINRLAVEADERKELRTHIDNPDRLSENSLVRMGARLNRHEWHQYGVELAAAYIMALGQTNPDREVSVYEKGQLVDFMIELILYISGEDPDSSTVAKWLKAEKARTTHWDAALEKARLSIP